MASVFESVHSAPSAVVLESAISSPQNQNFILPNVSDPASYVEAHFHGYKGNTTNEGPDFQFSKGTTTLGFKFQGGVIISVDSRSTQGSYIGA